MAVDADLAPFIAALAAAFPEAPEAIPAAAYRARLAALGAGRPRELPPGMAVTEAWVDDATLPPLALRIHHPQPGDRLPGILYFHGGGWVMGSALDHEAITARLAHECHAVVVSVDYRLAPEHPYPAALQDGIAAARWLAAQAGTLGIDPARLAVGGDSAGANLAAGVVRALRHELPPLRALALVYPALDDNLNTRSCIENADGPFLTRALTRHFWNLYTQGRGANRDIYLAPLQAEEFFAFPPTIVLAAGHDPLRDEAAAYACKLERAGIPVSHYCAPTMIHGFLRAVGLSPAAREAHAWLVAALRRALA